MNEKRRKTIRTICSGIETLVDELDAVKDEEQDYFDAIPENLQSSQNYETSETACDALEDATSSLRDIIEALQEVS